MIVYVLVGICAKLFIIHENDWDLVRTFIVLLTIICEYKIMQHCSQNLMHISLKWCNQ